MLERINPTAVQLASIKYTEADFQVLAPGTHVKCAISGKMIPLDELKYWNWQRQEAYVDADASLAAEQLAAK